ncbi:DUF4142 domain-containing protein [Noviherbaspirillum massiliense]|uniref:DUF4142 domain-containing protein n=1 Tax=Noviherbaspirillum massiliense TaxID=1465823 RepID=UPI0002DE1D99|nr:DUF4142 domain-containing protein [Noviherbaspirillum massiliense]
MFRRTGFSQALGVAALAMMFGAAPAHSQSSSTAASSSKPSSQASGAGNSSSASSSGGKSSASGSLSKADQSTMREMAQANLAEIEMGKIAMKQSKDDKVRDFAQKMIDDHTKAQDQLQQLAQSKGVTLPTEPDRKHQEMAKKLSSLSGEAFDRQYMSKDGVQDHKKTHSMLQRAATKAKDSDLKALVTQTQPVIDQHLQMAEEMTAKTTSTGASGTKGGGASSSGSKSSGK